MQRICGGHAVRTNHVRGGRIFPQCDLVGPYLRVGNLVYEPLPEPLRVDGGETCIVHLRAHNPRLSRCPRRPATSDRAASSTGTASSAASCTAQR
eukprot:1700004-Pyramimonas_sp.AAC.1